MRHEMRFTVLSLCDPRLRPILEDSASEDSSWQILFADKQEEALKVLKERRVHVLILDFSLSDVIPIQVARAAWSTVPGLRVVGLVKGASLEQIVSPIRNGFYDLVDLSRNPALRLGEVLSALAAQTEKDQRGEALYETKKDGVNIIGESPALLQVLEVVSRVAKHKWVTVLIRGETGTGKELIARKLHYDSSAGRQSLVEINCGAIPETLLEAELFGYEKGAFTDAKSKKKGLFEFADNGTLFLDEIGTIGLAFQAKLLKAIEEKTIRRVGGTEEIRVNTRIIAATNSDLQAAMASREFRRDLYYRLNVVTIYLPPLRERGDDVILLARHFLAQYAREYESPFRKFAPDAEDLMRSYAWPGNIRELRHTIERLVLLGEGEVVTKPALAGAMESDTPILLARDGPVANVIIDIPNEGLSLDEAQKQLIEKVLQKMGGHKRRTCEALKISRPRLDRIMKKYKIRSGKIRRK